MQILGGFARLLWATAGILISALWALRVVSATTLRTALLVSPQASVFNLTSQICERVSQIVFLIILKRRDLFNECSKK